VTSAPLTPARFKVDLAKLDEAITAVQMQAGLIGFRVSLITGMLQRVPYSWQTPAEVPFSELAQACTTQMDGLNALLTEMIRRMRCSYQNYLDAEQANVSNFRT
jgi:hypothetical protein